MRMNFLAAALCMALAGCDKPASGEAAMPASADAATTTTAEAPPDPIEAAPVEEPGTPSAASAAVRLLSANCPGGLVVSATDGGPVLINGQTATLKVGNPNYYEAIDAATGTVVSVSTRPDGSQSVSYTGQGRANGICKVEAAAPAKGKIVLFNASCPGGIEVHADDGGPIYINGNEATLGSMNPGYYEATEAASGVTISVTAEAGGPPSVSYTAKGGANGSCQLKD